MTALSATAPGAGHGLALAHAIHYAIVAAGIVGILALLVPQWHQRLQARLAGSEPTRARAPRDAHEARVLLLRAEIASGTLGTGPGARPSPAPEPILPLAARALIPAAFVASTAAAGVHAAMVPPHLGHQAALGIFFVASAMFQVGWAGSLVLGVSRRAALVGAVANLVLVGLWAVTRTVGLPGLMPEAIGPWDVACVAWELVVVAVCLRLLIDGPPTTRLAPWHRWDLRVTAFAVGSAAALAALSFSGFSG